MELTAEDLRRLPAENIRLPRAEFIGVWTAAEVAADRLRAERVACWDVWAVARTCRWLARADSRLDGRRFVTLAPTTKRQVWASPEVIAKEALTAEVLASRQPLPHWLAESPGYIEAVAATFQWVWVRSGRASLPDVLRAVS